MAYTDKYGSFFGRVTETGNVAILSSEDGTAATRLDASVYPVTYVDEHGDNVTSDISARYEHAAGIVLTQADAAQLGIEIER